MGNDFSNARRYLSDELKSISGVSIPLKWSSWFEAYCHTFLLELASQGFGDDRALAELLSAMNKFDSVGDFLYDEDKQRVELAAFGLILFDRILHVDMATVDHANLFLLHHELMECYRFALDDHFELIRARKAANSRHKGSREARNFVRTEWAAHRTDYQGNKSAFARDYAKRVWNELNIRVTEKTVRESWLADTPSASKTAGLPVDG